MGRAYAGILGPLAFALVTARGALSGGGVEGTLSAASAALFVFAAAGYLAGSLAEFLIRDAVTSQFRHAMAKWNAKQPTAKTPSTNT
jgi:hypothetical protein